MKITSVIKAPEGSIMIGLGEAAAVYAIYNSALPNQADIRSADPHNRDIEAARKAAAWKAAAILGLVFLITHDVNSFLIGGAALSGIDYLAKHANGISPTTGKLAGAPGPADQANGIADNDVAFPLPDYSDSGDVQYADAGY